MPTHPSKSSFVLLPIWTLWSRETIRFFRQRSRVIGALGTPIVFWLLFGFGFKKSFQLPSGDSGMEYLEYFFPGTLIIILLFAAIFSTISIIEDRREGFLQGVMVAPVHLNALVLGKLLGGTTIGLIQALLFLALAPSLGISMSLSSGLIIVGLLCLIGFGLTGLGFLFAWKMNSVAGFHGIMNLILMPMWLLSGASFPASGAHPWVAGIMAVNPLTYGLAAVRRTLYTNQPETLKDLPSMGLSIGVIIAFAVIVFLGTARVASKREKGN